MEKPRVLLADDNESTCTLIKALLRSDFTVDVVADGAEAVEKLRQRNYSAVLLDLIMPVVDGHAVLEFLRSEQPEMLHRVLVVTGSLFRREMERLRDFPIRGVIAKPFDVDQLSQAVRDCARGGSDGTGTLVTGGLIVMLAQLLQRG